MSRRCVTVVFSTRTVAKDGPAFVVVFECQVTSRSSVVVVCGMIIDVRCVRTLTMRILNRLSFRLIVRRRLLLLYVTVGSTIYQAA
jgi:hypothetical protein